MWSEYVPDGEGVAIQTTVGQLLQMFNGEDEIKQVTLAPITYGNYDEMTMDGVEERDDTLAALKYKGASWKHEREMRAVLLYNMYYVTPQLPKNGERLSVPISEFINRIIVAPNSTTAYQQKAREIVSGTSVQGKIVLSSLQPR